MAGPVRTPALRRPASERRPTPAAVGRFAATAGIVALLLLWSAPNVQAQVDAPTQYAPSGWLGTPNPTYTWSTVAGAITHYHLYVESVVGGVPSLYYQIYYTPGEVCSGSTCSATPANLLPLGHYQWWVRARSTSGWGHWSWYLGFDVWGPPSPTLHSPTGPITTPNPIYTWSAVGGAVTEYQIWVEALVDGVWTFKHQFFYTQSDACSGGTCSAMPAAMHGYGYYRWQMRSRHASGWGDWSAHLGFDVGPLPAPAPLSPSGTTVGLTPTLRWRPVNGVVDYYVLSVHQGDASNPPLYTPIWYTPADVCSGGTCSATPPTALAGGSTHAWKVWARNAAGPGYPSTPLSFVPVPSSWQTGCAGPLLTADFSGDGRTDRLCSASGVTYVSVATPTGFAAGTPWLVHQLTRPFVGDFDRDGRPDVADLDSATGEFKVSRSAGTAFTLPTSWGAATACAAAAKAGIGDFDGDGRTDVYCKSPANGLIHVGRSTGSAYSFTLLADITCDGGGERVGAADFDGDGLSDWYCGGMSGAFSVQLSTGTAFATGSFSGLEASFCSQQNLVIADLNADGAADALCPANGKVALSTGRSLVEQGAWGGFCLGQDTVFPADLDGDGVPELVCNNPGTPTNDIEVRRWTGTALGPVQTWRASWCGGLLSTGDFDGDSRTDLLCGDSDPSVAGTSGVMADLMLSSENGLGGRTTVDHRPSSDFPNTNNPPVKHVVVSQRTEDGRGGSSTTTYSYSGGKFDREERRSLGFASVQAVLPCLATESACPYVDTTFSQELPSAGRPLTVKRYDGKNQLLTETRYTYTNGAGVPRTSLLTAHHDYQYDPSSGLRHTHSTYAHDAYGNRTQVLAGGAFGTGSDDLQTDLTYSVNSSAYIVNRIGRIERRAPGGPALQTEQYEYDDSGNWLTPPVKGDLTAVRRWLDLPGRWVTRRTVYSPQGTITSVTDETNHTVTITYDSPDELFPETVANGVGEEETEYWDPACGLPIEVTDVNGQTTVTAYDALCRPTRTDFPLGGYVERFYLDLGNPNLQRTRTETAAAPGVAGRDWSASYFDGLGRSYESRKRGPSASQDIVVRQTHNARGGMASSTEPFYEGETARETSYLYDALDRVVKTVLPDAAEALTTYEANRLTTTDPNGKATKTRFDGFGRTVEVESTLSGAPIITQASYDRLGRRTGMQDAVGNAWSWTYDSLGRVRTENDPDAGSWSYGYDDAGRPTLQTDAKGQQTTLVYDAQVGRLAQRTSPAGTVTYAHGEVRAGYFNVGRPTTIASPADVLLLDYDALGRPVRLRRTLDGIDYAVQKAYDGVSGYLLSTTYPDGDTMGPLEYDESGRLRVIPGIVNSVLYDGAGRPKERTNANGTVTSWTYTPEQGFLSRILTTGGGGTIQDLNYTPDAVGLVQEVTSPVVGEGWSYGYDDLYRMTSATNLSSPAESQTFQYDAIGRITYNSRVGTYTYSSVGQPRPHAPLTVNGGSFTYDGNGNLTSGGGRAPIWDAENRITQIGTTQFTYDAFGERLKKVSAAGTSLYPFGDDYEVTNGQITKYISVDGLGVVAKRVGTGAGATTFWLHTDQQASIQAVTDASGAVPFRRTYRPYGETLGQAGSHTESRGWIDQRNDTETGLTYLHARYFDPKLGAFLSPDPIGPAGGLNAYAYGFGDPVNMSDREGLGPDDPPRPPGWLPWIKPIWDWLFGGDGDQDPIPGNRRGARYPIGTPNQGYAVPRNPAPAPAPTPAPIDIQIIVLNPPTSSTTGQGQSPMATAPPEREPLSPLEVAVLANHVLGSAFRSAVGTPLTDAERFQSARNTIDVLAWIEEHRELIIDGASLAMALPVRGRGQPRFPDLMDHASRHSNLSRQAYYSSAVEHMSTGQRFTFRHGMEFRHAYITRTGANSFTVTSTNRSGRIIFTHMYGVRTKYLRNLGITLPRGF